MQFQADLLNVLGHSPQDHGNDSPRGGLCRRTRRGFLARLESLRRNWTWIDTGSRHAARREGKQVRRMEKSRLEQNISNWLTTLEPYAL